ncbi:hypothetical protein GPK59_01210 [Dorea longicatena]|nr:hypothetical protein [Dorea longicatena]
MSVFDRCAWFIVEHTANFSHVLFPPHIK